MFELLNTSKDGFLTIEEIKTGIEMHHCAMYFEAKDWHEVLQSMDADGNGKVDFTEFIAAAYNKQKLLSDDNLKIAFKMFDSDGNGQITKEELKTVFRGNSMSKMM